VDLVINLLLLYIRRFESHHLTKRIQEPHFAVRSLSHSAHQSLIQIKENHNCMFEYLQHQSVYCKALLRLSSCTEERCFLIKLVT